MRKTFTVGLFLWSMTCISAQEVLWQKDIKSSTQDFLNQITTTVDGQFLISGSSIQQSKMPSVSSDGGVAQNNGYDFHLVKLNQQGGEVWEKHFGGQNHDFLTSVTATQDGSFLVTGTTLSPLGLDKKDESKGGSDIWLIKVSENGEEQWQRTLGTSAYEEAKAVVLNGDKGYVVAGSIERGEKSFGSKDVFVSILDKEGKEISQLVLGGKGSDQVESMVPTRDGGIVLAIYSRSGAVSNEDLKANTEYLKTKTENKKEASSSKAQTTTPITYVAKATENYGQGDYWLVKLDQNGKVLWQRTYGGDQDDHPRTLINTLDGILIGGESRSEKSGNKSVGIEEGTDVWLVALDNNGNEQWQKSYSFKNRDILMGLNMVMNAKDSETKGFLLGGYTQAEGRVEKDDETFWMLFVDPNGNEVWRKHVKGKSQKKEERLSDLKINRDGSIVLAGTSAEDLGKENWKIVKLGDKDLEDLIEELPIKIYPNPVDDYCYVEIGFKFEDAVIDLYDMSGKHIQSTASKNRVTKINTAGLIQGAYIITVKTNNNQSANSKIIKK